MSVAQLGGGGWFSRSSTTRNTTAVRSNPASASKVILTARMNLSCLRLRDCEILSLGRSYLALESADRFGLCLWRIILKRLVVHCETISSVYGRWWPGP